MLIKNRICILEARTGNTFQATYFGKELVIFHDNNYQEYAYNYRLTAQKGWQVAKEYIQRFEAVAGRCKPLTISPSSTITWKRYQKIKEKEKEDDITGT